MHFSAVALFTTGYFLLAACPWHPHCLTVTEKHAPYNLTILII